MDAITKELRSLLEREQIRDCIAALPVVRIAAMPS